MVAKFWSKKIESFSIFVFGKNNLEIIILKISIDKDGF